MARQDKMTEKAPNTEPPLKGVDIYKNISRVKLHTSMGIIWPNQEVMLNAREAKSFGDKLVSRT